mgnify:CR=1 FL=1
MPTMSRENHFSEQQTTTLQQALRNAVQHHTVGELSKAEAIYKQVLQTNPNHTDALHLLGMIAHQVGENDRAVDLIKKAIEVKPNFAEAHGNLGNALQRLGRLDEAVASYQKALSIKPDYAEAHYNLGNALKELKQLDDAIAHYHRALDIKPDYIDAYDNRGLAIDLQRGKKPFDHQIVLDQCFSRISQDDFDDATALLHNLCLNSPYKTQTFIKQFIDRCCEAIIRMLDSQKFNLAGDRIRSLYMLIEVHRPFDRLIQRYFDETENKNILETLDVHEIAVHLSMQSRVFYQNGKFDEAESCARQCIENSKVLLQSETLRNEGWFLIRKSLSNIKDSKKTRVILEELLLSIET